MTLLRWPSVTRPLGAVALTLVLALISASTVDGQSRGDTENTRASVSFSTSGQSVWGSGTSPVGPNWSYELFNLDYDVSLDGSAISSWHGQRFGGGVDLSTEGDLGLTVGMRNVSSGSLSITYPIGTDIEFPAPNSFAPGEPVVIGTSWAQEDGGVIESEAPGLELYMDGLFGNASDISFELCVFTCSIDTSIAPWRIPTDTHTMIALAPGGITVGDQFVPLTRWEFTIVENILLGVYGFVSAPDDYPTGGTADGAELAVSGTEHWVGSSIDMDKLLTRLGIPVQGGTGVNLGDFVIGYNFYDFDLDLDFYHTRNFDFTGRPEVTFDFPEAVVWTELDDGGNPVVSGNGTSVTIPVGHSLSLIFPHGRVDPMPVGQAYGLNGSVQSTGDMRFTGAVRDTLLSAELYIDSRQASRSEATFGWECQTLQTICDVTARVIGDIWDWVRTGTRWFYHTFGTVDESWGPEEATTLTTFDETETYFSSTWDVEGFTSHDGPEFWLDPEDPRIELGMSFHNNLALTGWYPGTVVQRIEVSNVGDVDLSHVQVMQSFRDYLNDVGVSWVRVIDRQSDYFDFDAWDGLNSDDILLGDRNLAPGRTESFHVALTPWAGHVVSLEATSSGRSPIGTDVEGPGMGSFAWAESEVASWYQRDEPGILEVILVGSEEIDVNEINTSTLTVEGVPVSRAFVRNVRGDHHDDLMVFVDRQAVIAAMWARLDAPPAFEWSGVGTGGAALRADNGNSGRTGVPSMSLDDIVRAVLNPGGLSPETSAAIDWMGNRDGGVDLGDLRAEVFRSELPPEFGLDDPEITDAETTTGIDIMNYEGSRSRKTLVVEGTLGDDTALFAEPFIVLLGG